MADVKNVKEKLDNKKLLTIKDACEYLSMCESRVRALLAEPDCSFVFRHGGRVFINRTILDKWIDSNTGR